MISPIWPRAIAAALACAAQTVAAQTEAQATSEYRSAFDDYRAYAPAEPGDWRGLNAALMPPDSHQHGQPEAPPAENQPHEHGTVAPKEAPPAEHHHHSHHEEHHDVKR